MYDYVLVPVVLVSTYGLAYLATWLFKEYLQCGPSLLGSVIGSTIVGQLMMLLNTIALELGVSDS